MVLADMAMQVEAARLLIYRAAINAGNGLPVPVRGVGRQVLRQRDGQAGHRPGHAAARRQRLQRGVRHRAPAPRRARLGDRRRHAGDPAHPHRLRAARPDLQPAGARGPAVTEAPSFELTAPYLDAAVRGPCSRRVVRRHRRPRRRGRPVRPRHPRAARRVRTRRRRRRRRATAAATRRVDSLAVTVVREALAFESAHLDSMFAMQGIGSFAVSLAGSDAVREHLAAEGRQPRRDRRRSRSPSRTSAPTCARSRRPSAVDGDELVVNGHKSFITNAGDADFYSVLCREGDGYSLVLVPADTPGVTITAPAPDHRAARARRRRVRGRPRPARPPARRARATASS